MQHLHNTQTDTETLRPARRQAQSEHKYPQAQDDHQQRQQQGPRDWEAEPDKESTNRAPADGEEMGGEEPTRQKGPNLQLEQHTTAEEQARQRALRDPLQGQAEEGTASGKVTDKEEEQAHRGGCIDHEDSTDSRAKRTKDGRQPRQATQQGKLAPEPVCRHEDQAAGANKPAEQAEGKVGVKTGMVLLKMVSQSWLEDTTVAWRQHTQQAGYAELKARCLLHEPPGIIKDWVEVELREHVQDGAALLSAGGEGGQEWIFPDDARWSIKPLLGKDPDKHEQYPCDVAAVEAATAKGYGLPGKGTYCMCCLDRITDNFVLRKDRRHGAGKMHFVNGDICHNSEKGYGWCPLHAKAISTLQKLEEAGWQRPSNRKVKVAAAPPVTVSQTAALRGATPPPQLPAHLSKKRNSTRPSKDELE
jgi:hypothetical protein